jgi:hypothetical protein
MPNLDETLLTAFMERFYGYGNLKAPMWFVGIEEGGGKSFEEVEQRIRVRDERRRREQRETEVEDLQNFHAEAEIPIDKLQRTWRAPIVAVLTATDRPTDRSSLLEYQKDELGSSFGETCLLDVLPLPKPGKTDWPYAEWSSLSSLATRNTYIRTYKKGRVERILRMIRRHEPTIVVFYGDPGEWKARLPPAAHKEPAFQTGRLGSSRWIITDHPIARSNDGEQRFTRIGQQMREWLPRTHS